MRILAPAMLSAAIVLLSIARPALGHETVAGPLLIDHPIARETAGTKAPGGAFMTIRNSGDQVDRLIAARTPAAGKVEFHESVVDGDIIRMRPLSAINLPARATVELRPGQGMHLMLINLTSRLQRDESFPMTLTFEKGGDVEISVRVTAITSGSAAHHPPASE